MGVQRSPEEGRRRGVAPSDRESLWQKRSVLNSCSMCPELKLSCYQVTCSAGYVVLTWLHCGSGLAVCVRVKVVLLWNVDWGPQGAGVEEREHLLPRPLPVSRPQPRPLLQQEVKELIKPHNSVNVSYRESLTFDARMVPF